MLILQKHQTMREDQGVMERERRRGREGQTDGRTENGIIGQGGRTEEYGGGRERQAVLGYVGILGNTQRTRGAGTGLSQNASVGKERHPKVLQGKAGTGVAPGNPHAPVPPPDPARSNSPFAAQSSENPCPNPLVW